MPSESSIPRHNPRIVLFDCRGCAVAHRVESPLAWAAWCPCGRCSGEVHLMRTMSRRERNDAHEVEASHPEGYVVPWMESPRYPVDADIVLELYDRRCGKRITRCTPTDLVAATAKHPLDPKITDRFLRAYIGERGDVTVTPRRSAYFRLPRRPENGSDHRIDPPVFAMVFVPHKGGMRDALFARYDRGLPGHLVLTLAPYGEEIERPQRIVARYAGQGRALDARTRAR